MKKSEILGRSAGGHDLELFHLGPDKTRPLIFLGGVHGDEPEGSTIVWDFIEFADKHLSTFKSQVLAIPAYNPDGLKKNERVNASGVDLNRNFPARDWSPEARAPRYYPGPFAASEPETKALVSLLKKTKPFLMVHFHTYLPQINYTGPKSKKWAEFLAKDYGHPVTEDIGYPTPGSLGQYCYLELDLPCVCVELPEQVERTKAWTMLGPALLEICQLEP